MPDSSYSVESVLGPNTPGLPTSMLAQPFTFDANYTATTTGGVDPGTKNFNFSGLTARVFLAGAATGSGVDETDPLELLSVVEANLGTDDWQVRMGIDGRVRVTYLSSTSGTITWGTAIVIARLLGFVDATLTVAEGETATAPYPPMGVIYCKAREKATDWTMRAAGFAGSLAGDGRVAGRSDGRRLLTQTFTSRVHPRTWSEADEYGSYATPLQSQDTTPARIFQPTGPLGVLPPWSVDEFAATALGHRCAFALGTFQSLVAGTRTDFEVGYLLPEMIRDLKSPKAAGNWRAFRDVDFALSRVKGLNPDGTETR